MKILGIDEAGRGSVLGPLVVGGVALEEDRVKYLERLGLKDSKKISPKRRIILARKIKRIAECHTVKITAKDIDMLRSRDVNLNEIEKIAINRIIGSSNPSTCFIDSMDVKPERLTSELETMHPDLKVVAEHKADDRYPIVSAASIIAKVERDRAIQEIKKEYKDIGSGYPSDPKTINFLEKMPPGELPDFVRRSWATVKRIRG
ncbi:ribonuclease HII [Methanobacterium ferruginis]|uniref:ribonuclease HII n=1 Tax=Methanobacterium ferruginis TaxID=710191 RepID=UPI00257280E1|nr:ribonuclease HII [Methanobacterium ferruginis]BDZ67577.1 ribonuclease HII [Methanobacterium ferruginis]